MAASTTATRARPRTKRRHSVPASPERFSGVVVMAPVLPTGRSHGPNRGRHLPVRSKAACWTSVQSEGAAMRRLLTGRRVGLRFTLLYTGLFLLSGVALLALVNGPTLGETTASEPAG